MAAFPTGMGFKFASALQVANPVGARIAKCLTVITESAGALSLSGALTVAAGDLTVTTGNLAVTAGTLTVGGASTLTGLASLNGGATIPTAKTLVVTDADSVTIGGIKVPQQFPIVDANIPLHASKVIYNLYVCRDPIQVTAIDYTPDIAAGSALTATAVKATGTATPASATTPLHIAGAINLNGAAHTVQSITPTVTTADLQLAVGDRIALVLSGAMTTGSGVLAIRGKRI